MSAMKIKQFVLALAACCLLIFFWVLSPSLRYEKASMGETQIRYDRLTGVIYLKSSPNPKAEWTPTKHKNIAEAKYHLAEKDLEEVFEETRKVTQGTENQVSPNEVVVIQASP